MAHILAGLLALMQLLTLLPDRPSDVTRRLRSGEWLRFHVIAQDDTEAMQQLKLRVRDAVQACYAANRSGKGGMLSQAEALLPPLTLAAQEAAAACGFTGEVRVSLGAHAFDERELSGVTVPAGVYPSLVITLGDGLGRNWWGLIDPEAALAFAAVPPDENAEEPPTTDRRRSPILWDWSWRALLAALFGLPLTDD